MRPDIETGSTIESCVGVLLRGVLCVFVGTGVSVAVAVAVSVTDVPEGVKVIVGEGLVPVSSGYVGVIDGTGVPGLPVTVGVCMPQVGSGVGVAIGVTGSGK